MKVHHKLKKVKINLLVHDYKLFEMNSRESTKCMFSKFTNIIINLANLINVFISRAN